MPRRANGHGLLLLHLHAAHPILLSKILLAPVASASEQCPRARSSDTLLPAPAPLAHSRVASPDLPPAPSQHCAHHPRSPSRPRTGPKGRTYTPPLLTFVSPSPREPPSLLNCSLQTPSEPGRQADEASCYQQIALAPNLTAAICPSLHAATQNTSPSHVAAQLVP